MTKIFLDLDGVMANFDKFLRDCNISKETAANDKSLWKELGKYYNLFYHLDLMPGSLKLVTMLQHHDIEVLTALPIPTGNLATAAEDKRRWVYENISMQIKVNTVVGGKNKWKWLLENPGSVLIDDYVRNIDLWKEHGGIGILHRSVEGTLLQCEELGLL